LLIAGTEVCGSLLGFRDGRRCTALTEPTQKRCRGHQDAEQHIQRVAGILRRLSTNDLTLAAALELARQSWLKTRVRYIPSKLRKAILNSGPCIYCGDPHPVEVEHIIPVARGGLSVWSNLAPACYGCNHSKSDQLVNEWRIARATGGLSWPPRPREELRDMKTAALLRAGVPEPFLVDLHAAAASLTAQPPQRPYQDDSRWQMARDAWQAPSAGLSEFQQWLRRMTAVEVMFRIESTAQEDPS
jgi:5-methylcytosine-specific restriction endonuclease McrA